MHVNFDGLRISIAESYNQLVRTATRGQHDVLSEMRCQIGGLLACHDPDDPNINAVHDKITLLES